MGLAALPAMLGAYSSDFIVKMQTGQALQHLFHRLEDLGLYFARRSSPPVGLNAQLRQVDIGKELHRKIAQTEQSEQDDNGDGNCDAGRIPDCPLGNAHALSPGRNQTAA